MSDFYRFPAIREEKLCGNMVQAMYVSDEAREAFDALVCWEREKRELFVKAESATQEKVDEARWNYGMELMDVIHAAETALRMSFADEELEDLRQDVIEKNEKRGYYDE